MKSLNCNSYVHIRLTKTGIKKMRDKHNELKKVFPNIGKFVPPEVDENRYTKMQLWKVMQLFGDEMHLGNNELPFYMDILIDDDSLEDI